jgi:hypothetical protein
VAGLRQLNQASTTAVDPVQPQFGAKDLLTPVRLSMSNTTELPSGESLTELKLTELKNSSSVSFGLDSCANSRTDARSDPRATMSVRIS